jgi:MFS family permease
LQSGLTFFPFTVMMIAIARYAGSLADKHGPRLLLICGPAVTGVGLLVLSSVKQTGGAADYWTTFFPGIILFGLGMSFTVAPLTAAVMGSVSDHLSGTASGVNNAMTRIAGVFANAIFGALAVLFFSGALQQQLTTVRPNEKQKQEIMTQSVNLGNAKVPPGLANADQIKIKQAYHESFISAYAKIMRISALLGFLGAVMAVIFIRNTAIKK